MFRMPEILKKNYYTLLYNIQFYNLVCKKKKKKSGQTGRRNWIYFCAEHKNYYYWQQQLWLSLNTYIFTLILHTLFVMKCKIKGTCYACKISIYLFITEGIRKSYLTDGKYRSSNNLIKYISTTYLLDPWMEENFTYFNQV